MKEQLEEPNLESRRTVNRNNPQKQRNEKTIPATKNLLCTSLL